MSDNVMAALAGRSGRLAAATTRNLELSKTFMALVANIVTLCNRKGCALRDVRFGPLSIGDRKLKSLVSFRGGPAERAWEAREHFADYAKRKALRMAHALDENPSLARFLAQLNESFEQYASTKGVPFGRLRIETAIIDRNDMLVLTLNR